MTLSVTPSPATGIPTKLTIVSDKRITPEVTETATITVTTANESRIYTGSRVVTPKQVAPITVTDSRGVSWVAQSDDGTTAVYVPA